jgi:PadR family transcriptional regulator PadR
MKKAGLLDYTWEESKSGPPRKYYTLTREGEETLATLEATWKTFSNSINELIKKHHNK